MKKIIFIVLLLGMQLFSQTVFQKKIKMDDHFYSYIYVDEEWNIEGTLVFSSDLECHVSSSGKQVCNNPNSYELDLINLKDIIFKDISKIRNKKQPLSAVRIKKYSFIYDNYNFKDTSYEALFSYLFLINNKYSKKKCNKINKFNKILSIKYLELKDILDVQKYNDMAYYIQKAGANKEAIYLLEKILKKFPNRTVAYYNLGDAYWEIGDKEKAIKAYKTYIKQMKTKGKEKKIPKKIKNRVKGK